MEIDYQRRKTVMARSIKLGHCVCNTQQGCPCDTLRDHNVCPCAGEKMPQKEGAVALTRHVRKAGCASKIGQADLLRILNELPETSDPNVLMGTASGVYVTDIASAMQSKRGLSTRNGVGSNPAL